MSVMVKKKIPKRVVKSRKRKSTSKKLSPLHPISLAHVIREDRIPTPLMEFIVSLEGELEYLPALREFQNEWCEHPANHQSISSTLYEPHKERYEHTLKCEDCGILRHRTGRAPSGRR